MVAAALLVAVLTLFVWRPEFAAALCVIFLAVGPVYLMDVFGIKALALWAIPMVAFGAAALLSRGEPAKAETNGDE